MKENKIALCILAHPDDAEFQCAGTLALLHSKGWEIVIASMTPGQAGSDILGPEEISKIRRKEAAIASSIIGGAYYCLECEDIFIAYDKPTLLKIIDLIRKVKPAIVFTASPSDYIVDHEITSKLVRTACLAVGIKNIKTTESENMATKVPHLYYCEPTMGIDIFGNEIKSDILIDISSTIEIKEKMLCCHKSQRDWLKKISNVDEFVIMMKEYAKKKGTEINTAYGEGFRQHLGFSYPTENILSTELNEVVYSKSLL